MATVATNQFNGNDALPSQFITRPEQLAEKIGEWKKNGFHVLAPAIQMSSFAPGFGVNASLVYLSHEVDEKGRGLDVYFDKTTMNQMERGPGKIGLGKLAAAAGVSWIGPQSGRRDPLTIQNLWIYQIVGVYLAYDGTPQTIHGEKEIDYRDGSAQIGEWSRDAWQKALKTNPETKSIHGWSESRVRQARMNGAERAETGAMERAIRMGFGIKHTYTVAELMKPFVALRVCALVDMTDPNVRAMVTQGQLAGVAALYAGTARRLSIATPAEVIDISSRCEPVTVGASSTIPPAASTTTPPVSAATAQADVQPEGPASTASPQVELPPERKAQTVEAPSPAREAKPTAANYVREVKSTPKKYGPNHAKKGQTFLKYAVIDGNGVEHVTIRESIAKKAFDACDTKLPVVIHSAPNSFRELELSDITPFVAAPAAQESFKL